MCPNALTTTPPSHLFVHVSLSHCVCLSVFICLSHYVCLSVHVVRCYCKASKVLQQYQHMPSFHGIQQDCQSIVCLSVCLSVCHTVSVCVCLCVWSDVTVKLARCSSNINTCLHSTAFNKTVNQLSTNFAHDSNSSFTTEMYVSHNVLSCIMVSMCVIMPQCLHVSFNVAGRVGSQEIFRQNFQKFIQKFLLIFA